MTKRRKYSAELKREAVLLAQQPDASCRQIALDIGINPNLLSRWKREAEQSQDKACDIALPRCVFCSPHVPLFERLS